MLELSLAQCVTEEMYMWNRAFRGTSQAVRSAGAMVGFILITYVSAVVRRLGRLTNNTSAHFWNVNFGLRNKKMNRLTSMNNEGDIMSVKAAARRVTQTPVEGSIDETVINLKAHVNNWKEIHEKNVEEHKLAFLDMVRSEKKLFEAEEMLAAHERGEVYRAE